MAQPLRRASATPRPFHEPAAAPSRQVPHANIPRVPPPAPEPPPPQRVARAIRADLLDFTAEPAWGATADAAVRYRADHWLLVGADGRIVDAVRERPGPDWYCDDHAGRLLTPGLVDSHVHAPQFDVLASHGAGLLDWLESHTFPAEARWADAAVAAAGADAFVAALLAHGTTTAVVFPTVHAHSADAVFAAASARELRIVCGKVLMDRDAPPALCDDVATAERDNEAGIERWHGRGRNAWAVTVRFALTSSDAQLALAGELCRRHAGVYLHTHVAESTAEVARVAARFPAARSYVDVYAAHGLLHAKSVLAHGIWLDTADRNAVAAAGALLAHCPGSNLFLGSGLFDWHACHRAGCRVALGSDVGGGTSLSLLRGTADAWRVQALRGERPTAWTLLHAATRGAAVALGLADEIGSLSPGRTADVVAWDWAVGAPALRRDAVASGAIAGIAAQGLHARVFALLQLGDERNVAATYVAGRPLYRRRDG